MEPGKSGHGFVPTRWSVVLKAAHETGPEAAQALETLCRSYWFPLYAFVRRQGHNPHDAEDLTQAFFARLIEKHFLGRLQREGGRFRSFLLAALKAFLANEWDRARAQKRGGKTPVISLDRESAETRYVLEPGHELTPDKLFEREWARTVLEHVLANLRREYEVAGKGDLFAQISASLSRPRGEMPYAEIAARLNTTEAAIKMAVQRLRTRYRQLLRAEVAETVAQPQEIEEELRFLLGSFN